MRGHTFVPDACDELKAHIERSHAHQNALSFGRGAILMGLMVLCILMLAATAQAQYVTLAGTLQGSNGVTAQNYTLSFTPTQWFYVAGQSVIVSTTSNCATSVDGSVVGIGNPLTLPTVTAQYTGTAAPGTYYVEYSFYSGNVETLASPETVVQLTSTGGLTVQAPAGGVPAGADGMRVFIGTVSGQETAQGTTVGNANFSQNVTPTTTSDILPSINATVCKQVANDAGWPTGTGYKVGLTDSFGNAVPGYPMVWQLLGPNTTINLSSGLPYYNGVVVFPAPLQANPYNHNQQSISSNLNFGGYSIGNVGTLTAGTINSVINAGLQTGSDIGAKINTASGAPCSGQCEIYIPAGNYNFSTPINLPMNALGAYALELDPGAVLTYTGSGCAITEYIATASPTTTNVRIHGGHLYGTSAAQCGIHIEPTNTVSIGAISVYGFTAGYGIWVDGANQVNIYDSLIQLNQVGVYASNTVCSGNVCSPTSGSGTPFSPNAVHVLHDTITGNSQWGVQFYDAATSGQTGALNPVIADSDFELNGSAGSTYGAISVGRSSSALIIGNYLEGSPRELVLGFPGSPGSFFSSQGAKVIANHFTVTAGTLYQIEAQDTVDLNVDGNSTLTSSVANSGSCFLNETEATGTFFGKQHIVTGASGSTGTIAPLCQAGTAEQRPAGMGSYASLNTNYFPFLAYQNFPITNSTSDTQAAQFVLAGNPCFATASGTNAANTALAQSLIAQIYVVPAAGSFTIYHPASSSYVGYEYNIWCGGQPN